MTRCSSSVVITAVVCGAIWVTGVEARQPRVNRDAQLQQDFQQRIEAYMALHRRLDKHAPPVKAKAEPEEIKAHQDGLAKAIRAERKGARQGEIFTPEIATLLRRLMYPELAGPDGADTKRAMKDDGPAVVSLKVNAPYPDTAPLATVPPNLLANLPQLPKDLEYRFVGRDLILRDVHANLIIDFMINAVR